KAFDALRADDDLDNFYMEREWRTTRTVQFTYGDIIRLIVPQAYVERLRNEASFNGEIITAEELRGLARTQVTLLGGVVPPREPARSASEVGTSTDNFQGEGNGT